MHCHLFYIKLQRAELQEVSEEAIGAKVGSSREKSQGFTHAQ